MGLEHRPLSSTAEPAGNGQRQVLDQLGDRILYGQGADITPAAWAQILLVRREEGTTLRDLRSYFSSTPAERSVMNNDAWLHLVRTGITNGGLQVTERRTRRDWADEAGYLTHHPSTLSRRRRGANWHLAEKAVRDQRGRPKCPNQTDVTLGPGASWNIARCRQQQSRPATVRGKSSTNWATGSCMGREPTSLLPHGHRSSL